MPKLIPIKCVLVVRYDKISKGAKQRTVYQSE
jgi:hypothetical protein